MDTEQSKTLHPLKFKVSFPLLLWFFPLINGNSLVQWDLQNVFNVLGTVFCYKSLITSVLQNYHSKIFHSCINASSLNHFAYAYLKLMSS